MSGGARPATAELLERDGELERLEQAVAAAADGSGSIVALEGEAGIGKTSLLAHAGRIACDAGMRVLSARGGELERAFAYGIVLQLLEGPLAAAPADDRARWVAGAARLAVPALSAAGPVERAEADPSSILHGLYWLLANMSADRPLLIAVDDAQWADHASIVALSYLARRVDELAIAIVYASRIGEGASDQLPAVAEPELASTVLRPAALSRAATGELVGRLLASAGSDDFVDACHTATNGNPFLLKELLRALQSDGVAADDTHAARVERIAPRTIARSTLARLRRLGRGAGELAFAVAVLGTRADLRHAAALARLAPQAAAEAADALAAAAILRAGRPLEFIHPIVRTTIYDELSPGRRAADHRQAAQLLADDGAESVALAPHLLASEPSGDPWVVERLHAAAREVKGRGAPDAACTYLERALREPPAAEDRHALRLALGAVGTRVLRPGCIEHLRAVLDEAADPAIRFEAGYELAWALVYADRVAEAVLVGREVLDRVPIEDRERRMVLEGWLAATAQFAPSFAKVELDRLARYEGKLTGATSGERLILACLAFGAAHRGESAARTAKTARLALGGGQLLHDHRLGSPNYYFAAWALIYAGRLVEAERYFDLLIEAGRRSGNASAAEGTSGSRCQTLVRQGRIAEAEADALAALPARGLHAIARAMLMSVLMDTMVERSDPRTWRPFLVEHGLDGGLGERAMGSMLLFSRARVRLAAGDAAGALADYEQLRRRDELSGLDTPGMPSRALGALAQLRLGEVDAARALAAEELARARRWGSPGALAIALRTAALVDGGTIELLRESAAAAEQSDARYELALSLTELGAALRRAGQLREARGPLRDALDLADAGGALRLASRAREELVASGARPRRAALRGYDALTPSERRVARLAADGLSNREIAQDLFVTLRTVEGHLTQTYMKLDICSREQLAAALVSPRG